MKNDGQVLFVNEFHFAPFGFFFGALLLLLAVVIPLIEPGISAAGYAVLSAFFFPGIFLFFLRLKISYDREKKLVLVRHSLFGAGFTQRYNIDDYRSMGSGYHNEGPDYTSSDHQVLHVVHYYFILFGKKGVKDLVLYSVSGAPYGFFPAEKKFKPVEDKMLRHLPLKQERYGP